jgi:uncharacterized protein YyaL (SSP411 family)
MTTAKENRLARESSPYLRQHARNPVDWYPWGEEALARARAEDKPIFLSIGYSACHWCHVMERESFENESIASLMNERFINIKVDREERPDLDDIYMAATQMLAGQGGWPNSVFLTPSLEPFYAGTYFPPDARYGRAGFPDVLRGVAEAYQTKKEEVTRVAGEVAESIRALSNMKAAAEPPGIAVMRRAFGDLAGRFDPEHGGFGGAPKFPHSMEISLLLRYHRRTANLEALRMAVVSLDRMARGGLCDQLGGGFHRYSVDAQWLVPHFEKMLYDNALLARVYVEAAQATAPLPVSHALPEGGGPPAAFFRQVAKDTLDWALREMQSPEGGFTSSLDADSEGEEGRFYVWTAAEIEQAVGRGEAGLVAGFFGVTPQGNFEGGRNILSLPQTIAEMARAQRTDEAELRLRLAGARSKMMQARERRPRPGRDDKVLADWNGLMIGALAFAGRVLDEPRYVEAAERAADMIRERMTRDGRLLHSWLGDDARHAGYLTDYAALAAARLELYEATSEARHINEAERLVKAAIDLFRDPQGDGFFLTARDHETLIARPREAHDGALPAGVSLLALVLPRLAALTLDTALQPVASGILRLYRERLERHPAAFGALLCAVDQSIDPPHQIVLAARPADPAARALEAVLRETYLPNAVLARTAGAVSGAAVGDGRDQAIELLAGKTPVEGRPAAYVCTAGACQTPVTDAAALRALLAPMP